jgi:hypothetical protein
MFELYTEKARRVLFFARYEANQFGTPYIETEHLLLGLLREDNALAYRVLQSAATAGSVREQIERHHAKLQKVITAVDLPLSHESKRVLVYGAEESRRMNNKHIGTPHLLLGLLREEKCFAADLLRQRGLKLERVREEVMRSNPDALETGTSRVEPPPALVQLLLGWEELGGIKVIAGSNVGNHTPDFAVYSLATVDTDAGALDSTQIAHLKRQISLTVHRMEDAIANHDFVSARENSGQERVLRASLRQRFVQHNVVDPLGWKLANPTPFLCIEIVRDESSSNLQSRFIDYLSAGVERVWVLDLPAKRTYTVTAAEGLRELTEEMPWLADRGLDLDLNRLFA